MNTPFDLIIIGSGPGGHSAAIKAAQEGLQVALVEKEYLGGVCLNVGCIPSKALIKQADTFNEIPRLEKMGLLIDKSNFHYEAVFKSSKDAVERLAKGLEFVLKKLKVELISGTAEILNKNEVIVDKKIKLTGKNIIIATGSTPIELPICHFNGKTVISSTEVLNFKSLPSSIMVLGGGVIGLELAYVLASFGVNVHIVEMLAQILPREDEEIIRVMNRELKKKMIKISTDTELIDVNIKTNERVAVELKNKKTDQEFQEETNCILVAVGRKPNSSGLGLEKIGIKTDNGYIKVNDFYQTEIDSIYAIGDVINTPMLAHVATGEGELAVEHILGKHIKTIDNLCVPSVVYTEPQLASFGYTEKYLKENNINYVKKSIQYRSNGKAVATDEIEGMAKIMIDNNTQEILGAHIIGKEATELIHELLLAKNAGLKPKDIERVIHAHPTFSEIIMDLSKS